VSMSVCVSVCVRVCVCYIPTYVCNEKKKKRNHEFEKGKAVLREEWEGGNYVIIL
jgi:hypothetical protein